MPIYVYECESCKLRIDLRQPLGVHEKDCPECGKSMSKMPTCQALVKINRLAPSLRREYLGTAPYTTKSPPRSRGNIVPQDPETKMEGEKWLESIE